MSHEPIIPEPIRFSALKHHLGEISKWLFACAADGEDGHLGDMLRTLKASKGVIDVYEGDLSASQIGDECLTLIREKQALDYRGFVKYLESDGEIKRQGRYTSIRLSDATEMTIRLGDDQVRFVHIHPSRYSPNTFRVHGNALTTAVVCEFVSRCRKKPSDDLEIINESRSRLGLCVVHAPPDSVLRVLTKIKRGVESGFTS